MRSSFNKSLLFFLLLGCLFASVPAKGDIIYPARLQMTETEPGIFEVTFVLPVVNGKVLKARPLLPEACQLLVEPIVDGDAYTKQISMRVACDPQALAGQKVGIEGLLGSQVDIFLSIRTLEGRKYESTLSPVNAFYVIPQPPSWSNLLQDASLKGMRLLLSEWPLYILLVVLVLYYHNRQWVWSSLLFVLAHALGMWLTRQWTVMPSSTATVISQPVVMVPEYLPIIASLIVVLLLAVPLVNRKNALTLSNGKSLLLAFLLGISFGAAAPTDMLPEGLSQQEANGFQGLLSIGTALGAVLAVLLVREFVYLLKILTEKYSRYSLIQWVGYGVGVIAVTGLLYESSQFWIFPSLLPDIPVVLLLYTLVLGVWLAYLNMKRAWLLGTVLLLPLAMGMLLVFQAYTFPYSLQILLASLCFMLIHYTFRSRPPAWLNLGVLGVANLAAGFHLAHFATENLSFSGAQAVSYLLMLSLLLALVVYLAGQYNIERPGKSVVHYGFCGLLAIAGLFIWFDYYATTYFPQLTSNLAMGFIQIPFLSLLLLIAAWMVWPRYRSIHKKMQVRRRYPVLSLTLMSVALLLLPYGLKAENPWYSPHAPGKEEASKIMHQLLSHTYTAFNLKDENELFTQLSQSVSGELIDDLYLDSRRRLNVGLREGAEVKVEEVEVINIGNQPEGNFAEVGYIYPAEWIVTARVKHLQHIHFRQNRYTGSINIKREKEQWKISGIILKSEDRSILAASAR